MREIPPIEADWLQVKMKIQAIQNQLHINGTPSIPGVLQEMLVYGEDHRFFQHRGYDMRALLRAAYRTISGHPQGGSTIAQQLARVVTGRFDRSIYRKLRELRLAVRITESFPREQIPALYLMVAYFGWRMNGLVQAYHRLKLSPIELSDEQAAGLIARLKYPEPRMSPESRTRQIAKRTAHILKLRSNPAITNSMITFSNIN
ncbi:MAG: transglycosylase domain-containing protein [Verrucomicrobia bacterium]|nr:transglycosylase domain-containing protein [Verrucomicrobiota bacterium]